MEVTNIILQLVGYGSALLLLGILFLALTGTTIGVRRRYIRALLWIFEYGRYRIESAERQRLEREREAHDLSEQNDGVRVIKRAEKLSVEKDDIFRSRTASALKREFSLADSMRFCKVGIESIIEDEVTQRFAAEELYSWNLLTRTNANYQYISFRLTVVWVLGFFFRYFILLPFRISIILLGTAWLVAATALVGYLPDGEFKRRANDIATKSGFRILARSVSAIMTYNDTHNAAKNGGICVANHTSPIDVVLLSCSHSYALIGQSQGGFLGVLQRAMYRASDSHIWFERSEVNDRHAVAQRLRRNVGDTTKLPILIFPEGTCVNNTSVMMFKKGSFETGATIFPVAIKYDPRFGDPFWNSTKMGFIPYMIMMMTSWAIVCDTWFLPPMSQRPGETSVDFASRVKGVIARKGGLVDLEWDGQLKRIKVKETWKAEQQHRYSRILKVQ